MLGIFQTNSLFSTLFIFSFNEVVTSFEMGTQLPLYDVYVLESNLQMMQAIVHIYLHCRILANYLFLFFYLHKNTCNSSPVGDLRKWLTNLCEQQRDRMKIFFSTYRYLRSFIIIVSSQIFNEVFNDSSL